jgi:hypothetical protein
MEVLKLFNIIILCVCLISAGKGKFLLVETGTTESGNDYDSTVISEGGIWRIGKENDTNLKGGKGNDHTWNGGKGNDHIFDWWKGNDPIWNGGKGNGMMGKEMTTYGRVGKEITTDGDKTTTQACSSYT